jgi:flagellar hook-length control protein FliK
MNNIDFFSKLINNNNTKNTISRNIDNNFLDIFTSTRVSGKTLETPSAQQSRNSHDRNTERVRDTQERRNPEVTRREIKSEENPEEIKGNEKNYEEITCEPEDYKEYVEDEENIAYESALISIANLLNISKEPLILMLEEVQKISVDNDNTKDISNLMKLVYNVETVEDLLEVTDIAKISKEMSLITEDASIQDIINNIEKLTSEEYVKSTITSEISVDTNVESGELQKNIQITEQKALEIYKEVIPTEINISKQDEPTLTVQVEETNDDMANHFEKSSGDDLSENSDGRQQSKEIPLGTKNNLTKNSTLNRLADKDDMDIEFINMDKSKSLDYQKISAKKEIANATLKRSLNTTDIINQINERLKFEFKGDTSEIRVRLNPENLGDVTLKISTLNGIVTAQFLAENERVKEIIESNFNILKNSLENQGIEIGSLSVSVGQENSKDNMQQFLEQKQKTIQRANDIANKIMSEEEVKEQQDLLESKVNYVI